MHRPPVSARQQALNSTLDPARERDPEATSSLRRGLIATGLARQSRLGRPWTLRARLARFIATVKRILSTPISMTWTADSRDARMMNSRRVFAICWALSFFTLAPELYAQQKVSQIRMPGSTGTPTAGYRIFMKQSLTTVGLQIEASATSDLLDQFCDGTLCFFKTSGDAIRLSPGGTNGWDIGTAWHLAPTADNTYDIGDATHSVRDLFIGTYNSGIGNFTTPTHVAGDYTGSGSMTWTVAAGDVTQYRYEVTDKKLIVSFVINATTVGGTPSSTLQITIPGGFTAATRSMCSCLVYQDAGGATNGGYINVAASSTIISLTKFAEVAWSAATDTTSVYGQITIEVN